MIKDFKGQLQDKLTASLVNERNTLNDHLKAITELRTQSSSLTDTITDVVD